MGYTRPIAIALLGGIVVIAHFSLGKQAEQNGTIALADVFTYTTRTLPNTKIPINIPETGIAAVDNYFAFMVSFFWTTLDTRNVRAHLQGQPLLGTLSSIWLLMLSETHRGGRGVAFAAATYSLEIMGELLGIGMFTGVWCIVHLLSTANPSTTSSVPTGKTHMGALGWAVLLGHVVPTLGMIHLKADGEGIASQQVWTILRLFHPIFVFGSYKFLSTILSSTITTARASSSPRKFYIFSILASGLFHVSSLSVLLGPYLTPGWFKDEVSTAVNLHDFYIPYPFWADTVPRLVPFDVGVATFLQWDNICSASAIVVWAAALYLETGSNLGAKENGGSVGTFVQAGAVGLLAGPGATAAFLMLERDSTLDAVDVADGKKWQ